MGIAENYKAVLRRIESAARQAGRDPSEIKLVAVSKTHPVETLNKALNSGINVFGENKVQEAETKVAAIGRQKAEWHLIGNLQKNKARKAVQNFDVIHTLDSLKLGRRLERICEEEAREALSILIQVDIAREETKSGIKKDELPELVEFLKSCKHLRLDGLMIIPPYLPDPEKVRPYFKELRLLRDKLLQEKAFTNEIGELSMGMSHDFEVAIEEGATLVRVGTAIFGQRQKPVR